jgi:hypothetical protein
MTARIFFSCCIFLFYSTVIGQKSAKYGADEEIQKPSFLQPYWEFWLSPNINQKAILTHAETAIYQLQTAPQISGEAGIGRSFHFSSRNSIVVGIGFGLLGRNGSFMVPDSVVGIPDNDQYYFTRGMAQIYDVEYFTIPLLYEHRVFVKNNNCLYFRAGINLKLAFFGGTISGDENILEIEVDGNRSPILNFNLGAGYGILLRNKNILKLGIQANLDPAWIARGNYTFRTNVSFDYGTYLVKATSIGLNLSYVLTKYKTHKRGF